ncbi:MAG: universal stress protein, partial [Shewanella sp.]
MRKGKILWPTDFSETAAHALSYAIEMANLYNVGLKILHVVEQPVGDENFLILSITPEELANNMEEAAATKMQALLQGLNTDLPITTVIRHGDPVKQILEEANSKDIGMVVIASHGRTGISHFLHTNV